MTTNTRRSAALSTAIILATGMALISATPAQAAGPPDSCTSQSVCGYVNTGFRTNQGYELIPAQNPGVCIVVAFRNAWSGVYNNSGQTIRLFKNTSCSGTDYKQFTNGTGHHQLSVRFPLQGWDNSIDAVQFR